MDRRDFITIGAPRSRAAIRGENRGGLGGRDASQNAPIEFARRSATDLVPYGGQWTYKQAAHLLRRAMFGPTETEIRRAVSDGLNATLDKLFTPFEPLLTGIDAWANDTQFQAAPDTAAGEEAQAFQQAQSGRRDALLTWILRIMKQSPVSIQERLRFFWHGHFTTEMDVIRFPELAYQQYRLFARHMLGNFKQFVYDVTVDFAMLIYLDGIKNYKIGNRSNINENYARELMELYTMGVYDWDGNENYTQDDVIAAARALSGWTYNVPNGNPRGVVWVDRLPVFNPLLWDNGQKTLMGRTGQWDAQDVIDIIFEERGDRIAKFICTKIYRAFVYDVPDQVIVEQMADLFRTNDWEIRPVIEALLTSEHFFDETNIGALHKGPVDYIVGTVRSEALEAVPGFDSITGRRTDGDVAARLTVLGQVPYFPPNVKGWPGGRTWTSTSTLPVRQKFSIDVANGLLRSGNTGIYQFDPIAFARLFPDPDDIHALSRDMAQFLLNTSPSQQEADILFETILDGGKDYEWSLDDPGQRADQRIRKFVAAAVQLAKHQLY